MIINFYYFHNNKNNRKHKKTKRSIGCESKESSKSNKYTLIEKKILEYKYNEIKKIFPKKEIIKSLQN